MLSDLATLIARGGAWRFLHGPVVAADEAHYPEPWEETRAGVARVLARTLWHAHAAFDATLEDARAPGMQKDGLLRNTLLQLTDGDGHAARFVLHHIGNDDVAGIAAHEVGRAFVAWLAREGHPFRAAPEDGLPAPALGSLATVYLGLGVVAANAAYHSRTGGKVTGNLAVYSHVVGRAGGLDVDDLAFLLAVQAEVRDDVLDALGSLRPTQAEAVAAWRAVLEDHEDELRQLLGLDAAADQVAAPDRPAAPRPVSIEAAVDEALLGKRNHGKRVFRVPASRVRIEGLLGGMLGLFAGGGMAGAVLPAVSGLRIGVVVGTTMIGFLVGHARGTRKKLYRCATCESFLDRAATVCPACGGTIAGDIAHRGLRLDAEEALEAEERRARRSAGAPEAPGADDATETSASSSH
ncbi:MAG TPA: hypothetical protein VFK02_03510 [Kofleriaceae bacterium]|nr:hypothetical protein [Kofleriaceae bacterium]